MKQITQLLQLAYIRSSFWILSWISPKKAADRAFQYMITPRAFPEKEREQAVLGQAAQSTIPYKNGMLQFYRWGQAERTVLLVHGWEGRAGNYGRLVPKLLDDGWSVVAFDAPSHGQSDKQATSMFEFTECLGKILETIQIEAIVAHSFGCVAAVVALSENTDKRVPKLVMLASPNQFEDRLQQMVDLFRLSSPVVERLRTLLQSTTAQPIFDFSIADLGDRINVGDRLLLHDKADKVSLFAWSQEIAARWSQIETVTTKLIEIEGTGHNRILWDADVISYISSFLSDIKPNAQSTKSTVTQSNAGASSEEIPHLAKAGQN